MMICWGLGPQRAARRARMPRSCPTISPKDLGRVCSVKGSVSPTCRIASSFSISRSFSSMEMLSRPPFRREPLRRKYHAPNRKNNICAKNKNHPLTSTPPFYRGSMCRMVFFHTFEMVISYSSRSSTGASPSVMEYIKSFVLSGVYTYSS